ncbi:MAG: DUF4386 family protein [Candidatus Aminicenantes bacterium]|nr:DUF4386 family protein [Candidatus Aminicenantes bacterium]
MNKNIILQDGKRIGTGLAFVLIPLIFIFAFSVHPGLLTPHFLGAEELIHRAHQNELLQFGHMLVTLGTVLLIVMALHFMTLLKKTAAWAGSIGGMLAIVGAVILAVDKGALCLTMSALHRLSEPQFSQMIPGLLAMFSKEGWLVILWGLVFLPIGFAIQAIALIKTHALPRWQSILFLIGVLFVGTPDGVEIINLCASVLMAVSLIPYGVKLIKESPMDNSAPKL